MMDEVRKAMADMEAKGFKPSVRSVRVAIGRGSHTDIGEAMRKITAELDLLNAVRSELPQSLQDKASIISLDFWVMAQELANRVVEDVRRGCESRVAHAEAQASCALHDIDDAEAQIRSLLEKIDEMKAASGILESSKQAGSERAANAEARVAALEAEIRARIDYAARRDRELELAYSSIDRMAAAIGSTKTPAPRRRRRTASTSPTS